MSPHQILKDYFGYSSFRTGQEEIINSILKNKNVLAVMPTGSGKSLCFQIPALIKENFSIVISPLISLMKDQVEAINRFEKISAYINSSLDYSQMQKVLFDVEKRKIKLLYVSPEKLNNQEFVENLKNLKPYYLFIDEAHCISEWGHSFRPSYRNIQTFAKEIGIKNISAFTATATQEVRNDIQKLLKFENPKLFVYGFERENLSLHVVHEKDKKGKIINLVSNCKGSLIIYTATRGKCEKLAKYLREKKIKAEYYHGGLKTELRRLIQDDFINNNFKVIVATNAFGMGIDKKDIERVIHYNIPGSIENLYQEFGRAGRDGREAEAYLFFSEKDKSIQEYLIALTNPTVQQIRVCYDAILDYYKIANNTKTEDKLKIDNGLEKLLTSKAINSSLVKAILNSLEVSGYLKQLTGKKNQYEFQFLLSNEKLKSYLMKLANEELRDFILTLLQYYGTVPFSSRVYINFKDLMNLIGSDWQNLKRNFEKLNSIGIIDLRLPTEQLQIQMKRERIPSKDLLLNTEDINQKLNKAKEKLQTVIDFCLTERCRFQFILDYFGENAIEYKCGKCDNCSSKNKFNPAVNDYIQEIISKTFKEFTGGLTIPRLAGILLGKSKSQTAKSISTYQSCMHYSVNEIEKSIQLLLSKNLIKEFNGKLFWDPVNELAESEKNDKSSYGSDYESNLELFNKLREERDLASKKFSQHPDLICSDDILKKITKIKPKTPASFLCIDKVNQRMFNKIGYEFLEIIKEHKSHFEQKKNLKELPQHISQTFSLVKKGYSLEEISNFLKLPQSIISIQLETIIKYYPNEDYSSLISEKETELIKEAVMNYGGSDKNIKEVLPKSINYAKIRIVKALISVSQLSPEL